ncbi:MAG TPA: molybdopterin-dependent oxidoreductase, partial [Ktedonobacteraceae bacterium]
EPDRSNMWRGRLVGALIALPAGLVASILSVVVMGSLLFLIGTPTPVEMFGDFVLKHIDVGTFIRLLATFKGAESKSAPLGLALLGMVVLGTLLGPLYAALVGILPPVSGYRPHRREWLTALGFCLVMSLLAIVLFWIELPQNHYGLPFFWARTLAIVALVVDFGVYAAVLCLLYRVLLPKQAITGERSPAGRRQVLARAGVVVLGIGGGLATLELLRTYMSMYTYYDGTKYYPAGNKTPPITPNNLHYVVTQNPIDPATDINLWRLEITGLIQRPGVYTYDEVLKLPTDERAVTLECIANGVGDHFISTAVWKGVPLRTLLNLHGGAQPTASYIAFHSVDGYTVSLPLKEVLDADPLLAYHMNQVAIPARHGYPMRVLIPGRYGEENPKWLTRIELTDHFVSGLYSDQGWYNGPIPTISRIDGPKGTIPVGQPVEVAGLAFSGYRGISKVEVSTDDGATWQQATLEPPLSKDSWVLWNWSWKPSQRGTYTLVARATDGTGETQTAKVRGTVPDGATGYHKVTVVVA